MKYFSTVVRWLARVLGIVIVIDVVMILAVIGDLPGLPDLISSDHVALAALVLMIVGVAAAWKWEWPGSLIIFAGFGILWAILRGFPAPLLTFFPFIGCLHLIAWLLDHQPGTTRAASRS